MFLNKWLASTNRVFQSVVSMVVTNLAKNKIIFKSKNQDNFENFLMLIELAASYNIKGNMYLKQMAVDQSCFPKSCVKSCDQLNMKINPNLSINEIIIFY